MVSSSRKYTPTSSWWNTAMAVGSNLRESVVDRAVTPNPYSVSSDLKRKEDERGVATSGVSFIEYTTTP